MRKKSGPSKVTVTKGAEEFRTLDLLEGPVKINEMIAHVFTERTTRKSGRLNKRGISKASGNSPSYVHGNSPQKVSSQQLNNTKKENSEKAMPGRKRKLSNENEENEKDLKRKKESSQENKNSTPKKEEQSFTKRESLRGKKIESTVMKAKEKLMPNGKTGVRGCKAITDNKAKKSAVNSPIIKQTPKKDERRSPVKISPSPKKVQFSSKNEKQENTPKEKKNHNIDSLRKRTPKIEEEEKSKEMKKTDSPNKETNETVSKESPRSSVITPAKKQNSPQKKVSSPKQTPGKGIKRDSSGRFLPSNMGKEGPHRSQGKRVTVHNSPIKFLGVNEKKQSLTKKSFS